MDQYGFYGDVSYSPQARVLPYSQATYPQPPVRPQSRGLGAVRPVRSGGYVGAPGKKVQGMRTSRQQDHEFLRGLGMTMAGSSDAEMRGYLQTRGLASAGLGSMNDRQLCQTISRLVTSVGGVIGAAAIGSAPTRNAGESSADFQQRLNDYQTLQRTFGGSIAAAQQAANFCNLIEVADSQSSVNSSESSALIANYQAQLQQLVQQQQQQQSQGMSTGTKVALGAGAVGAVGLIAYLLL